MMKRTAKIALSGVLGALSLGCLLLTVFPFATYALPALASVFFIPVVIECGRRWAVWLYIAVALLALLMVPDMEARLLFVTFFGYYPIVKSWAEQRSHVLEWVCKVVLFNVAVVAGYWLLAGIGFSFEAFVIPGISLSLSAVLALFLVAGNVVFLLYDVALTRMLPLYFVRFQPLLRRFFK